MRFPLSTVLASVLFAVWASFLAVTGAAPSAQAGSGSAAPSSVSAVRWDGAGQAPPELRRAATVEKAVTTGERVRLPLLPDVGTGPASAQPDPALAWGESVGPRQERAPPGGAYSPRRERAPPVHGSS